MNHYQTLFKKAFPGKAYLPVTKMMLDVYSALHGEEAKRIKDYLIEHCAVPDVMHNEMFESVLALSFVNALNAYHELEGEKRAMLFPIKGVWHVALPSVATADLKDFISQFCYDVTYNDDTHALQEVCKWAIPDMGSLSDYAMSNATVIKRLMVQATSIFSGICYAEIFRKEQLELLYAAR